MNGKPDKSLPNWLPLVVGSVLVLQFAGLGGWQISRGLDKRAQQELFSDDTGVTPWSDGMQPRPYQRLKTSGQFDVEHQFLLENIILNGRYGYYVLTPLETAANEPLLLVNRGWIEKTSDEFDPARISMSTARTTVRGRAGSLPRAGYKMGDAIVAGTKWPQLAVYPNLEELAGALGRDLQDFVLLMDPDDQHGFVRHWVPEEMGPGRHFAYALQWFAMGAVLAILMVWHYPRRRAKHA